MTVLSHVQVNHRRFNTCETRVRHIFARSAFRSGSGGRLRLRPPLTSASIHNAPWPGKKKARVTAGAFFVLVAIVPGTPHLIFRSYDSSGDTTLNFSELGMVFPELRVMSRFPFATVQSVHHVFASNFAARVNSKPKFGAHYGVI